MSFPWTALVSGIMAGLASTPHCAAMCGPLSSAACRERRGAAGPLRYQLGRTLGYALAGSIVGQLGEVLMLRALPPLLLPICVAALLVLQARSLWRKQRPTPLLQLDASPPRRRRWRALLALLPRDPLLLGGLSALLPCGALAAALLLAAASGRANDGAVLMIGFATSSGLGVFGAAWLLNKLMRTRRPQTARVFAFILLLTAALVLFRPIYSAAASPGGGHADTHHITCH